MTHLTDTQMILLSHASQAASGSLYPLPASLRPGGGTVKAIDALVRRGLVEERETSEQQAARRSDGDLRYGLFITAGGLAAINAADQPSVPAGVEPVTSPAPPPPPAKRSSKAAAVLALLARDSGATLAELIDATGWLPHTTRAALTGLRKKGHAITCGKRGEATCYTLAPAQA